MRKVDLRFHETQIGIWQDDANDPSYRKDVFIPLVAFLRRQGWTVTQDPDIARRHPVLRHSHKLAVRGDLRAELQIHGRNIALELWAETWPIDNKNGRRYDFRKLARMNYLDRQRVMLLRQRIAAWLAKSSAVTVSDGDAESRGTPMQRISARYATSWHTDKSVGRPICTTASNATSSDQRQIEHGSDVWFRDRRGRWVRGRAYYNINNMWWVVCGSTLHNEGAHHLYVDPPANLRHKVHPGRRAKLELLLSRAVRAMDLDRAKVIKTILFGDEPVFLIWARDHSAFYRAAYSGYVTDSTFAGRYTRAEAEAECRRVPHELEMVGPDGVHVRFDKAEAA